MHTQLISSQYFDPDIKPPLPSNASHGENKQSDAGVFSNDLRHPLQERDILAALGIDNETLASLEAAAFRAGAGLAETAIARGVLKAADFYSELAKRLALSPQATNTYKLIFPFVPAKTWQLLQKPLALPITPLGTAALNAQAIPVELLAALSNELGEKRSNIKLLTRQTLIDSITYTYGTALAKRAVLALLRRSPQSSAKTGLAPWQIFITSALCGCFAGAFCVAPYEMATIAAFAFSVFFLLAMGLRFIAAAFIFTSHSKPKEVQTPTIDDNDLPRYTIFVPLFRETAILPYLAKALSELDYPSAKLDIKIVLESIDTETIETALGLPFPGNVDFIVVPDCQPRTKPKALNYALQFATGELAVIFDAEDRPEPDQLRKAAYAFHKAPADVVCFQARLDYFNATENWLSRQFTLEYASLFRGILPFLAAWKLPLPLGGTSNHFRMDALRALGAWDPYNVTEDADLGLRLHRKGWRTQMLDSTTYEEACCHTVPWIKQRTRWLKGWLQTYGVHTRQLRLAFHELRFSGFLAFQAYFAGILIAALAHPVFYVIMAIEAWNGTLFVLSAETDFLLVLAYVNFIGGFLANALLGAAAVAKTNNRKVMAYVVFIPIYWFLISIAAYRAVWQLIRTPFYWEKTEHGVSKKLI